MATMVQSFFGWRLSRLTGFRWIGYAITGVSLVSCGMFACVFRLLTTLKPLRSQGAVSIRSNRDIGPLLTRFLRHSLCRKN